MGILDKIDPKSWIAGLFKPVADLVDNLHTSKEEKGQIEVAITGALTEAGVKILDYETKLAEAQSNIIIAEAQGQSWLQRNWRPMMMCEFGIIIAWNIAVVPFASAVLGLVVPPVDTSAIPAELWMVIKIGVGGYIGGRSLEKITDTIMSRKR
jgi:hypothetical protein